MSDQPLDSSASPDEFAPPGVTRRYVLLGGLAAAVATATYSIWSETLGSAAERRPTLALPDTAVTGVDLPFLPHDDGTVSGGVRTFDLRMAASQSSFIEGAQAETWGINREFLGPVLHVDRGDQLQMRVTNALGEPTTLHWHGVHLPAEMDGGPFQVIEAGDLWEPNWEVRQSAATLWFHPHLLGLTRDHVMKGLAGILVIHDDTEEGLPTTRDEDDFAIILQETTVNAQGVLDTSDGTRLTMVNGAVAPTLDLPEGPARLRLVNASDARVFDLAFDDFRELTIVGVDGGRLNNPVAMDSVKIGPGERVELLVDHAGASLVALDPEAGRAGATNAGLGEGPAEVLIQLEGGPKARPPQTPPPSAPRAAELPDPDAATVRRHMVLQEGGPGMTIVIDDPTDVDAAAPPPPPDQAKVIVSQHFCSLPPTADVAVAPEDLPAITVTLGTTEIWEIENVTDIFHFFHVHDVQFRVLDRDGNPPLEHERGRKDTVRVEPGSTVRIALEFTDYVNTSCAYMFHCHMLTHEDQGMMGHFVVVEPGGEAPADLTA